VANENEKFRDHMRQTEKDTIDVVTFLKKQDGDKDSEVTFALRIDSIHIFLINNRSIVCKKKLKK
jgi:hypothetical protein